jgi:heme exporter protein C
MSFKNKPILLIAIDVISAILLVLAFGAVYFYAPFERTMGWVQKIFYFHVGAGWIGMLGFFIAAVCGVGYLRSQRKIWDMASIASVEIGLFFSGLNIISGSIWARPIWNTWWTWDPRLTTVAVMSLTYGAYFVLRKAISSPAKQSLFGAVYSIIAFINVPLTFFSIRLFRTIHPVVVSGVGSDLPSSHLTGRMQLTLIFSLIAFTVLYLDLLWHRIRLEKQKEALVKIRVRLSK